MTPANMTTARFTLVVGCDVPQAAAAAALLAEWKTMRDSDIQVLAASKASLPALLGTDLSGARAKGDQVIILGVPVSHDPAALGSICSGLKSLKHRGVETHWLGFPVHAAGGPGLADLWTEHIADSRKAFPAFVFRALGCKGQPRRDLVQFADSAGAVPHGSASEAQQLRLDMIRAALHDARQTRKFDSYVNAIWTLANSQPTSESLNHLIDRYRKFGHREFAGSSAAARKVCDLARSIGGEGTCSVLITGETGVGKETVAYMLHENSPRRDGPFVAFNCGDLNPELLASRLFGHEAGAFTGATKARPGVFEAANSGTVFLDEIGDLPLGAQAMLLRVLQEGRFNRLGAEAEEPTEVDVRVVAATHRDLRAMVKAGTFREDLFYRVSAVCLQVPALRERVEDLPAIAESFYRHRGWRVMMLPEQWNALRLHAWPGNVREFQNALTRMHVFKEIDIAKVLDAVPPGSAECPDDSLDAAIRRHVRAVCEKHHGNKARTAKALGVAVNTLKAHLA